MTLNLVTTCDLVNILQRPFFNLLYYIFGLVTLYYLVDFRRGSIGGTMTQQVKDPTGQPTRVR